MTEDAECAVCHQPIPKGRVHYGGVSCYSCRAFFRRNTQREELPICKGEERCRITYMDRKQCSSCRYTKCIRTGMRPELVLNEDEKKRRFKKLLRKKEEEASNVTYSPEPRYSDDESLYDRAHEMPALEPIKTNPESLNQFPRAAPFSYPFPPSTSPLYPQSMFPSTPLTTSQQWKRYEAHKTKNCIRPGKDFLTELRSEVKYYVENNQYEHKISQTSSSSIHQHYPTSPHVFSISSSSRVQVKPHPHPCMPSPPSSPEEELPMAFSHRMKDVEAWRFFANKGFLARNIFPHRNSESENAQHQETQFTTDLSKNIFDPRPSVITNQSCNYPRSLSPFEEDNSEKLDDDCETKSEEEYDEKSLETIPVSSTKVYLPENLSITKDIRKNEPSHVNDDLIFKYVHKKFRTHVDHSEKDLFSDTFPQKRKSVIFHASTTKKICVE
jgi:hypothetical protein